MFGNLRLWPEAASNHAYAVDALSLYIFGFSLFIIAAVFGLVLTFVIGYRRRPGVEPPRISKTPWWFEPAFLVGLTVIVLTMFFWGAKLFIELTQMPPTGTDIGKQWMWKFQHPGGQREINELHVPAGRPIRLTMASEDVIHSLYFPAFRSQQEVIPGRYTQQWFAAIRPGVYPIYCTEYCGTQHSDMIGRVVVMEPAEYQQWLAGGPSQSPAEEGERLFLSAGCAGCHRPDQQARCPNLAGLPGKPVRPAGGQNVVADDAYLRESILVPAAKIVAGYQPIMPSYAGQLSEEQVLALIAYIKSLESPAEHSEDFPPAAPGDNPQIRKAPL